MSKINQSINVLKFISAFAVVCIHTVSGDFKALIMGLCGFAVPVFFLISGYYSFYDDDSKAVKKYKTRSIRLIKLIIASNLLYFFSSIQRINFIINHDYLAILSTLPSIYEVLLLNHGVIYHLWFLGALLYTYIILIILIKIKITPNKLYKFIPILFIINIFSREILKYLGIILPAEYFQNVLLSSLPVFMLGYYIHDKEKNIIPKLSNKFLLSALVIVCCLFIIEMLTIDSPILLKIGKYAIAIIPFIYCVKNPSVLNFKRLGWIGGTLYAYIYILHPLVIGTVGIPLNLNSNVFLMFILTVLVSFVLYLLIKKLKELLNILKTQFHENSLN